MITKNVIIDLPKFLRNRLFFLLLARQQVSAIRSSKISAPALKTVISLFGRQRWSSDSLSFAKCSRHHELLIRRRLIFLSFS